MCVFLSVIHFHVMAIKYSRNWTTTQRKNEAKVNQQERNNRAGVKNGSQARVAMAKDVPHPGTTRDPNNGKKTAQREGPWSPISPKETRRTEHRSRPSRYKVVSDGPLKVEENKNYNLTKITFLHENFLISRREGCVKLKQLHCCARNDVKWVCGPAEVSCYTLELIRVAIYKDM